MPGLPPADTQVFLPGVGIPAPRAFSFTDVGQAQHFMDSVAREARAATHTSSRAAYGALFPGGLVTLSSLELIAGQHGGSPVVPSTRRRETYMYGYPQVIHDQDRDHLHQRHGVTFAINTIVPRETWMGLPRTYEDPVDEFFRSLTRLGFVPRAIATDTKCRRRGHAFLCIKAGGDSPASDLRESGGAGWRGFKSIPPWAIDWSQTTYNHTDALLPYGIETLAVKDRQGNRFPVHGTRLVPFVEDEEAEDDPRSAKAKCDPIHDALWNHRDYEFMLRRAQTEGNPIIIELDVANGYTRITDKEASGMQDEAVEVRSGARDAFGPNVGTVMKRLGAPELDDPEWGLRTTVGTIASATEFTANMLMVFSRGSEQITDADRNDHQDAIEIRRSIFANPILQRMWELGVASGFVRRKRGANIRSLELPTHMRWPFIRRLSEREEAFVLSRQAATVRELADYGRLPPPYVDEQFPDDPSAVPDFRAVGGPVEVAPPARGATHASTMDPDEDWAEYEEDTRGETDPEKRKKKRKKRREGDPWYE